MTSRGPWRAYPQVNEPDWMDIVGAAGRYIGEAGKQDAQLIASAPDLVSGLVRLRRCIDGSQPIDTAGAVMALDALLKLAGAEDLA